VITLSVLERLIPLSEQIDIIEIHGEKEVRLRTFQPIDYCQRIFAVIPELAVFFILQH
jgi:hypothetical protein